MMDITQKKNKPTIYGWQIIIINVGEQESLATTTTITIEAIYNSALSRETYFFHCSSSLKLLLYLLEFIQFCHIIYDQDIFNDDDDDDEEKDDNQPFS